MYSSSFTFGLYCQTKIEKLLLNSIENVLLPDIFRKKLFSYKKI